MQMPGRKYSQANTSYRYGFNGKENDNDVKGDGNQQDYGMRIYDPRLGKFLSVDPVANKFPMLTPYQFASKTPVQAIDLDGKEALLVTGGLNGFGLIAGYQIDAGFAISPTGIAFYLGQTIKGGAGLELGASLTGTFFPKMRDLNDLDGYSFGGSVAGGILEKFGIGIVKSSGKWGGSFGGGPGVGLHISGDVGITISLKVYTWEDIVNNIDRNGKAVLNAVGIKTDDIKNIVKEIKDYYKQKVTEIIDQKTAELNKENEINRATIKGADEYLKDYQKRGFLYKILSFNEKQQAGNAIESAKQQIIENKKELDELKSEKQEIQKQD